MIDENEDAVPVNDRWERLLQLYFLAYKLSDATSVRSIVAKLIDMMGQSPVPFAIMGYVYANTATDASLHRLFVDYAENIKSVPVLDITNYHDTFYILSVGARPLKGKSFA